MGKKEYGMMQVLDKTTLWFSSAFLRTLRSSAFSLAASVAAASYAQPVPAPVAPLKGLAYDAEFFPGAKHDPEVPTPDTVLGFRLGDKPVTHAQVESVLTALAAKSPRVKLFEYARSHEGRALYYLAISSDANIRRIEEIKRDQARIADPRTLSEEEGTRLLGAAPAIAWMAYAIHGDEMSGTDAALALAWHLASGTDEPVVTMLNSMVVLIDPLMNPDGRDRCVTGVRQNRTVQPSTDEQSVLHSQVWPGGRTNHYFFDLNRDWMFGTQPESRGRIRAVGEWSPHYFVESHEQDPLDTFLFMPSRAPINPNIPETINKWSAIFGADQAGAFDKFGWRYYTGEWNEEWYPGYSGSWAALRGAIDNLYEQARLISDAVRRPEGTLEAYREAVHKQLVSSVANLETLSRRRAEVMKDFADERRRIVAPEGPFGQRTFAVTPPPGNTGRWLRFVDLMELQGIEVYKTASPMTANGRDALGRDFTSEALGAGTILIPARQPIGRLATALLEPDPRMSPEFLAEERRELLRFGQSRLYDITGWNVAMLFGMQVRELATGLPADAVRADFADLRAAPGDPPAELPSVGYLFDGADDRCVPAAARLMDRGVKVRVLNKPSSWENAAAPRGSVIVARKDNTNFTGDLRAIIADVQREFGVAARPLASGWGPGDNPDLGGQHAVLLETPRVAVLTREPFNPYTAGEIWHLLDHEMGLRVAYINTAKLGGADLRRYNVIVIPDGGEAGWADKIGDLRGWVHAGGTLIAIGSSAGVLAKEKDGIGTTRLVQDVLTKLGDYRLAIVRDWLGKSETPDPAAVWSHTPPEKLEYPWLLGDTDKLEEDEAKRRDEWRALFTPQGAILAARVDDRSWLTAGCAEVLPVLIGGGPVLVPKMGGNAPLLLGTFVTAPPKPPPPPAPPKPVDTKDADKDEPEEPAPGWTLAPPGFELRLRMSGLLWPEAADRLAHSAYVTRESVGAGQVILFASSPTFRGAERGTMRVFMNAVVCGPGMGASAPITP